MTEDFLKNVAIKFSNLIVNKNFSDAYKLTTNSYQTENTLEQMMDEYQEMMESFDFIEGTLKVSPHFGEVEDIVDLGDDERTVFVTIDGLIQAEGSEPYESYTVFHLIFSQEESNLAISFVNFDGRA